MPRRRKTDAELAASGSANLSRRRAEAARKEAAAQVAAQIAAAGEVTVPPLPRSVAEWHALIRSLPGYDPFALAGACRFDVRAATRPLEWIQSNIRHTKGRDAGRLFVLSPWQRAFVANLFGWLRPDGTRRFREALLYVGKKQGKSALVSAIACYLALEDGEKGPEVYCAAAKREQAKIIWSECVAQLARIDPTQQRAHRYQHSVSFPDGGFLKPISADAGTEDGMNPSAALIDELHRQPDDRLVNVIRFSTAARAQPLVIMLTTADEDRPSVCNDTLARARDVRDNPGDAARPGYDPEFLPAIYEAGPDDDWTKPETWRKANPNLGVTVSEEFLAKKCREAQENPTLRTDFLRYHLNLRVSSAQAFFDAEDWDACEGPDRFLVLREKLKGKRCFGGLDLASVNDLASLALWFPEVRAALWFTWCPRDGARDREHHDKVPYMVWAGQGALILTGDGPIERTVSYGRIRQDILRLTTEYDVVEIGFDRAGANETVTALRDDHGVKFLDFSQSFGAMTPPMREVRRLLGARELVHGGDPVARWAMLNVVPRHGDVGEYIMPSKKRSRERIDPAVALMMAVGVSLLQPATPKRRPVGGSISLRAHDGDDD